MMQKDGVEGFLPGVWLAAEAIAAGWVRDDDCHTHQQPLALATCHPHTGLLRQPFCTSLDAITRAAYAK
jgi:hypothetical protein